MIGAIGGITMQPGVEKTLLDMVTETNAAFDMMVGKRFPRIAKALLRPVHSSVGVLEIVGVGALTLCEKDVGHGEDLLRHQDGGEHGLLWPGTRDLGARHALIS